MMIYRFHNLCRQALTIERLFSVRSVVTSIVSTQNSRVSYSSDAGQSNSLDEKFKLIYHMPYAQVGSVVNRLKIHLAALTAVGVPASWACEIQNIISEGSMLGFIFIAALTNLSFHMVGLLFHNLIGRVYMNEETLDVKIAYVGYWGKRHDTVLPLEVIGLPTEIFAWSLYHKVTAYNPKITFKLHTKHCQIYNMPAFQKVFGESLVR